jgi:hypothetical protein
LRLPRGFGEEDDMKMLKTLMLTVLVLFAATEMPTPEGLKDTSDWAATR